MLITVEGVHGCGKTTIVRLLYKKLRKLKFQVVVTADQTGTSIGRKIRELNLKKEHTGIAPFTEALLIAAARHQTVVKIIEPNLTLGKIVVCERYSDAFFAFQSFARGLPVALLQCINDAATEGIEPDLTILLDVDPYIAIARIKPKSRHRIENEPLKFHYKVRKGYLFQADKYPDRIKVFDGASPIHNVFENIWGEVKQFLVNRSENYVRI